MRLQDWLGDTESGTGDRLIVMHGMSSRVLRGLLTGATDRPGCGAPVADGVRQGSMVEIEGGVERVIEQEDAFDPI
jgi:probable phosphoglycerate mutase